MQLLRYTWKVEKDPALASELRQLRQKVQMLEELIGVGSRIPESREKPRENRLPAHTNNNPYDARFPDELLDLYDGYSPVHKRDLSGRVSHGPFSWLTFMKKDSALNSLLNYMVSQRKHLDKASLPVIPKDATTSRNPKNKLEDDYEEEFRKKALDRASDSDAPFVKVDINELKVKMNQAALTLGLTMFEGEVDQKLQLVEKIKLLLPNKKTLWTLVNRFFVSIYPFMSLVDEAWLRGELKRLLGPELYSEDRFSEVRIEKRLDLATMVIVLTSLRLAYLSAFSNNKRENEQVLAAPPGSPLCERQYILKHPINIEVISLAKLCMEQFDLLHTCDMIVFQAAFLLKGYQFYCPEEGDGVDGGDSRICVLMMVQIAYVLGIHREHSLFDETNDIKAHNLGRKIWNLLRIIDLDQAMLYGFPLLIQDGFDDVKLPLYRPGASNIQDVNLEKALSNCVVSNVEFVNYRRRLVARMLNIKDRLTMKEATQLVSEFEDILLAKFGTLSSFTSSMADPTRFPFEKMIACKSYLNGRLFIMTLKYHFFLNYERSGRHDLAFHYLHQCIKFACGEFILDGTDIAGNNHIFDADSTTPDLFLTPTIEFMLHKTNEIILGLWVRFRYMAHRMKKEKFAAQGNFPPEDVDFNLRLARISRIERILKSFCLYVIASISKLSSRYYYAWRLSKAHTFVAQLIEEDNFIETVQTNLELDADQLSLILSTMEDIFAKVRVKVAPRQECEVAAERMRAIRELNAEQEIQIATVPPETNLDFDFDFDGGFLSPLGNVDAMWQKVLSVIEENDFSGGQDRYLSNSGFQDVKNSLGPLGEFFGFHEPNW